MPCNKLKTIGQVYSSSLVLCLSVHALGILPFIQLVRKGCIGLPHEVQTLHDIDNHSSGYLGMATVCSIMVKKCHQKKPLLLSNGATEPRTDSMAEFSYRCSLCKCILKYVVHSE